MAPFDKLRACNDDDLDADDVEAGVAVVAGVITRPDCWFNSDSCPWRESPCCCCCWKLPPLVAEEWLGGVVGSIIDDKELIEWFWEWRGGW